MIAALSKPPTGTMPPPLAQVLRDLAKTVSASRLNTFHSCRLKFFFRYVRQVAKPPTAALAVGKAVHSVLQAWNLARWRGREFGPDTLRETVEKAWADPEIQTGVDWQGDEAEHRLVVTNLVDTYLRDTPIPPGEKPQGVEVSVEADLALRGGPRLIGIIDLVRPGGLVVDFKTSGQTPSPDRSTHQNELQLTCYGVLYREATGQKEAGFELHHLVKTKVPKLVVVPVPAVTAAQETRLYRAVESYISGLERKDFVPSPGLGCAACEYFLECRAWSGDCSGGMEGRRAA